LLAASKDAARESRFDAGSRRRKSEIALEAAPLVAAAGRSDLSDRLIALAQKLKATDCWGAGPRNGLSAIFSEAALLLEPEVEVTLRRLAELADIRRREDERAIAEALRAILGSQYRG